MTFKIHLEANNELDTITITGDTIEEIRERAEKAVLARGGDLSTAWSEEITAVREAER